MGGVPYSRRMPKVLLYELNEVPWEIVDLYVERRPQSNLAKVLTQSRCQTTHNDDPNHLSPWRTWPTFHTGRHSDEHNSFDLGQDPATFRGKTLWEVAEAHGRSVGLFGVLQTWPPRRFANGAFYVPDTFARTPATVPRSLERFQEFNLSMTGELGFSPDAKLPIGRSLVAGLDMVRLGLTPWSIRRLTTQLVRERRDGRFKAGRSMMQALPAFDLFWRLHSRSAPDLSIFFTNHVAGMMHRFWGDAVPTYSETYEYEVDSIFRDFLVEAMDIFDRHLGRMTARVDRDGDAVLIIAASMGQGGVPYHHIAETYVVDDAEKLADALGLGPCQEALAMYPMNALEFPSEEAARRAGSLLSLVSTNEQPLISDVRVDGRSLSYGVRVEFNGAQLSREAEYCQEIGGVPKRGRIEDLGITTANRLGGGNTAYHTPDGILIIYGPDIEPDETRSVVDVRQASVMVMDHLGLADAWNSRDVRT